MIAVGWYYTECAMHCEWRFLHFVHCVYDLCLVDRIGFVLGNTMHKGEEDGSPPYENLQVLGSVYMYLCTSTDLRFLYGFLKP